MIHVFNHKRPSAPRPREAMKEDFEFADAYYLDREDFATLEADARDFVRFDCKGGRFQ